MKFTQFITVFIVLYLLWFICRWFVFPHLRIFPYIPPVWLWTTLYGIFVYIMNMLFLWIMLYLIICYVSWVVIRRMIPNFPIPLKSIILGMAPWKPLTDAGILQFIDKLRSIFISNYSLSKRAYTAGNAIAGFLQSSFKYLKSTVGYKLGSGPMPNADAMLRPDPKYRELPPDQVKKKNVVRRSTRQNSIYEEDEMLQIQDEYLQCVEENSVPVFPNMGIETAQAIAKNRSAATICKLNMMKTYANLMYNRV